MYSCTPVSYSRVQQKQHHVFLDRHTPKLLPIFPASVQGRGWSVRSWWVTLDLGAASSTELALPPGAAIFGNMTKTSAAGDWYM